MGWGQDPNDRERDFDPWNTERRRAVPAQGPPDQSGRWGGDATPERLQPLSLGDVLDGTFRLARKHWRAFALGLGVVVVPLSLLSGLELVQVFGSTPGVLELLQNPELATRASNGSGLSGLAGALLTPLIYGIAVWIAARAYRVGTVDPMEGVRAGGRRYLPLLGAAFLLVAVPLLMFLLPGLLIGFGVAAGAEALLAIGVFALIAALVVSLLLLIRLMVTIPVVMLEDAGPLKAMRRSNSLVKGRTGFVLGTMLVVYIVVVIVQLVLTVPFQLAGAVAGSALGGIILTVGTIIGSLLSNTLLGSALVLIYFDRRVRAEGYDLSELAEELGDPPTHGW